MSPFKHVHNIQGKIKYEFLVLNAYWIICVSFAVKYRIATSLIIKVVINTRKIL